MGQFGIGQPVRRKEDLRLLTGKGRYTDDVHFDGQLWIAFFRSPHAHANILSIDTTAAREAPGVAHVFVGADLKADGAGPIPVLVDMVELSGKSMYKPVQHIMPIEHTRMVGEPLAMVLADTTEQARAAADMIAIDFEELPSVTSPARALTPDSPLLYEEHGSNLLAHCENRAPDEIDAIIAASEHKVMVDLVNNRVVVAPMEPRCAVAVYDPEADRTTLYCPTQGVRSWQLSYVRALNIKPEQLRVVSGDVGGGFGIRSKRYTETLAIAWAAKRAGRPVKWRGDRSETFVSDYHARDQLNHIVAGFDANGCMQALRVETIVNTGA